MTASATTTTFPCPRCGNLLVYGQLACPRCDGLVYGRELARLAEEAQQEERAGNVIRATMLWRQMLTMLPPDSRQYDTIARHVGGLTSQVASVATSRAAQAFDRTGPAEAGRAAHTAGQHPATGAASAGAVKPNDPLPLAIAKTGGSMLISILVYAMLFSGTRGWNFGLQFATGFVLLILVHELGHSLAMRYFGLSASPPIFIPFLGAVINLRQMPRNALEEAIVGIGGPVLGTIGAGLTYLLYLKTGSELLLRLAEFGFLLNLFNMMPVPPLDGGRVTAAVTPWIWIPGLLGVAGYVLYQYFQFGRLNPIWILLLFMAWPRVVGILKARTRNNPYYRIGWKAQWTMGAAYAVLAITLGVMYVVARVEGIARFGSTWFG